MWKVIKAGLIAGAAIMCAGTQGQAATVYATAIDWANNGSVGSSNDRDDETNALGGPNGDFLALGLTTANNEGFAVFSFGGLFEDPAVAYEITFNCSGSGDSCTNYPESADVYVGTDYDFGTHDWSDVIDDFTMVGTLDNGLAQAGQELTFAGQFTYLAIVDRTKRDYSSSPSTDGFDVDAIGVAPAGSDNVPAVPIPAPFLLLLSGLLGLGFAGRFRKTA